MELETEGPPNATDCTIADTSVGPVRFLHTIKFDRDTSGTILHYRFGPPETRKGRDLAKDIAPAYNEALESAMPELIDQTENRIRCAHRRPRSRTPAGHQEHRHDDQFIYQLTQWDPYDEISLP